MISLKKILVPTDFSESSEKAVRYASELASKFGATVHLLHIVENVPVMYGEGGYFTPDTFADLEAAATKHLETVQCGDGLDVTRHVLQGHPFVEIIRFARDKDVDLIVVGTHGRGAIAHLLLGSVAEKIVRKAPCPVLTVRDQEHDFVMP